MHNSCPFFHYKLINTYLPEQTEPSVTEMDGWQKHLYHIHVSDDTDIYAWQHQLGQI